MTPQAHSRRTFLHRAGIAGGTGLVIATGGLTYRAYDQGLFATGGGAYDAWADWQHGEGPMALVSAAILAANPHNSQAWVFAVTPTSIDLYADRQRALGSTDPFDREMYVGLGCALENLLQAAPAHGYRAALTLLPTPGQAVHAAHVELTSGPARRGALYEAIPNRRTERSPYRATPIAPGVLTAMSSLIGDLPGVGVRWFTSSADRARVGALMIAAAVSITEDEQQSRDAFKLFRSSSDDIERYKDGLTLDAQGLSGLTTAVAKMLPGSSRGAGDEFWIKQTRTVHTRTAAAYGIVTVPDAGSHADRLAGGRALERIHLWATANGVALHHMNQVTERLDREREQHLAPQLGSAVRALVSDAGEPLVAFRLGYAHTSDGRRPSPRRPAVATGRAGSVVRRSA